MNCRPMRPCQGPDSEPLSRAAQPVPCRACARLRSTPPRALQATVSSQSDGCFLSVSRLHTARGPKAT